MRFDPTASRRSLKSYLLKIDYEISIDEAAHEAAIGSWGCSMLNTAVECYLVGLFSDAIELVLKAKYFLHAADEKNEKSKTGEGIVLERLALANWFQTRRTDVTSMLRSIDWKEGWFAAEKTKPDKVEVQLSLAPYFEAESYELLIARYESAGLKKPANLRRIQGEGTMCYVMARHRLGLEYTDEEVAEALETFLKRSVKEWLGRYGTYTTVARWMKIAHWKPGNDPIATLLRCYDYLPGLKPPKYPPKVAK